MLSYVLGLTSGLFVILVIQFGLQRASREQAVSHTKELLLQELWFLLNAVSQVSACYRRNLTAPRQPVTPGALPRAHVMPTLLQEELAGAVPLDMQAQVLEVTSLLDVLAEETDRWSEAVRSEPELLDDGERYQAISARMLELVGQVSGNLVQLWVRLAVQHGAQGVKPEIRLANRVLRRAALEGQRLVAVDRSSSIQDEIGEADTVVCWEHDWVECPKRVVELSALAATRRHTPAPVPAAGASGG